MVRIALQEPSRRIFSVLPEELKREKREWEDMSGVPRLTHRFEDWLGGSIELRRAVIVTAKVYHGKRIQIKRRSSRHGTVVNKSD